MPQLTCDVVVLGGGGAGLATAARAGELGLSAVVLERADQLGGTTARAVGSVAAAAGPPDSPDLHARDIAALTGGDGVGHETLLHTFVRSAPGTLAWLRSLGIRFVGPVHDDGSSAHRLYNALPHAGIYVHVLEGRVRSTGGQVHTGFRAGRLLRDGGRVVGVEGRTRDGEQLVCRASRAVVLATGDFSGNDELKRQHLGTAYPPINPSNDGSGFALAASAGGVLRSAGRAGWAHELRFVAPAGRTLLRRVPPSRATSAVLAHLAGRAPRRVFGALVSALSTTYLAPSPSVQEHGAVLLSGGGRRVDWGAGDDHALVPGENYAIVLDRAATRTFETSGAFISTAPGIAYAGLSDYRRFRRDLWHRCATADEVAATIGAPAERVTDALAGRPGPFVLLGPARAVQILTDGGLDVDESLRVLTDRGLPVPGLYAVGAAGQSCLALPGHGNHLGWALTSGRLAAERIRAQEADRW
ncbi:FAD-dependent oxidoreductase [Ornithinimicrobium cavernae]|uniref:FAD-dependent oxidoreductase n=1 Tax=Ornithinimicrobium cavernae TaxID=2666047 RepID=UPI000D69244A|nr:FAD-dependent oxidoreductase [Ornithinimicrobium cavernae]